MPPPREATSQQLALQPDSPKVFDWDIKSPASTKRSGNSAVVKSGKKTKIRDGPDGGAKKEILSKIDKVEAASQKQATQRSTAGDWRDHSIKDEDPMQGRQKTKASIQDSENRDPLQPADFRKEIKDEQREEEEGADGNAPKDYSTKVRLTEKLPFNLFVGFCVTFNTLAMGMEQEHGELGEGQWYSFSLAMLICFVVEMIIRIFIDGFSEITKSPSNIADLILVAGACVDALLLAPISFSLAHKFRILTVFRMLRLLRLVKIIRVHTTFKELWLLVGGLVNSMKALIWIGVIVVLVLYVCSILVTTEIGQNDEVYGVGPSYDGELWPYKEYFGNIWKSMFTLFQVMTLDDWCDDIVRHVVHRQPAMGFFFIAFLMLTAFGLMNVVVGIIVENTLAAAEVADSVVEQQLGQQRKKAIVKLEEILKMSDVDRTGEISKEDLLALGESPVVLEQLQKIGLQFNEALEIFNLLDYERRNRIELVRFAASCHELVGGAKRRDIVQVEITVGTLAQRLDSLDHKFVHMEHEVGVLHEMADDFVQNTVRVLTGYDGSQSRGYEVGRGRKSV
jgi:voltage-gated sodium channel